MSDSEEDYMSDKFFTKCQEDIRPGLLYNTKEKRKHELYKKHQEVVAKKPKTMLELERESLEKGLTTAISSENKGFKLLEKMGFKAGDTLGKAKGGLKEPINIVLRQGTSGVGKERHDREVLTRKISQKDRHLKDFEHKYRVATYEKSVKWMLKRDFLKAQRICEELDFRENICDPIEDFYWTKETIKRRRIESKQGLQDSEYESDDDSEFDEYITEDNLASIIDYLRERHVYCLYCVITGANQEDLQENCPGPYRIDHDDD